RRQVALDRLQRRRRLGRGEVVEEAVQPRQQAAAAIEGRDRVLERWGRLRGGDGLDLGALFGKRLLEGGPEVFGPGRGERRQAVRCVPDAQQRIARGECHGGLSWALLVGEPPF